MSCFNITPLVLSDTFNTWFERSNQCIEGLNSFKIRGLSATNNSNTNIKGFVLENTGGCYYTIDLRTGPFIGFVTSSDGGYDSGIHGTGNYENPYNLTLKFNGTEEVLDKDEVVTGDYLIVSDTDDSGLLKKTTADAFLTRLRSGSKITVDQDSDGVWTISFVPLEFIASFSDRKYNTTTVTTEIGFTHNSGSGWTGAYTYGPTTTTDPFVVLPFSITIGPASIDSSNMSFTPFGGTGGGSIFYPHETLPVIPTNRNWFGVGGGKKTDLAVSAGITSSSTSFLSPFYPFTPTSVSRTTTYRFAWRYSGFSNLSELNISDIQNLLNDIQNLTTMNLSGSVVAQGGANKGFLVSTPSIQRTAFFDNPGRLYFLLTAPENYTGPPVNPLVHTTFTPSYGFRPIFRDPLGGAIMEEGWEELGIVSRNFNVTTPVADNLTKNYIVYRSVNSYDAQRQIIIGG